MPIQSFRDKTVEKLFSSGAPAKAWRAIAAVALRKLDMLDAAQAVGDLKAPPGNRLEALKGDRKGQHSIRINDQYRICFRWTARGAEDVEIVDYH
jgi:proteic killer suppression protein